MMIYLLLTCLFIQLCVLSTAVSPVDSLQAQKTTEIITNWKIIEKVKSENTSLPIVCYLSIKSGLLPTQLNLTLCTHIILLSSRINDSVVVPSTPTDIKYYYEQVVTIKKLKPGLKVLLSSAGDFPPVLLSATNRKKFAASVMPYLTKYNFDGLDIDWEFPAWSGQPREQRHNFTLLLQVLRETLDNLTQKNQQPSFLLTAAVASTKPLIDGCYEIPHLSKYLDFINLMTYDIHGYGSSTPFTGHNSPMYSGSNILDKTIFYYYNMVSACELWVKKGMKKEQIMVGIPAYAHTFTLLFSHLHGVYSLADGYSKQLGNEIDRSTICYLLKNKTLNYTQVWDNECKAVYAYSDKTWISYDNVKSISEKIKWIKENNYGGIMTFSLDSDDYNGANCGQRWPIHSAIYSLLKEN